MAFHELDGLVKRYGEFTAVAECELSVAKGEFVCLLGPSGCGKTTTLQMVAGFTPPTAGRILLDGQDITGLKPNKRGLGIVFQSYALFPHMTVADNVAFGLEMRGIDKTDTVSQHQHSMRISRLIQVVLLILVWYVAFLDPYVIRQRSMEKDFVCLACKTPKRDVLLPD